MALLQSSSGNLKTTIALEAAVRTADTNGASIDTLGYNLTTFIARMGAEGDTLSGSLYSEFELEHCDDGSTWVDCANDDLSSYVTGTNTGTFGKADTGTEAPAFFTTDYIGGKRYVRCVLNVTGTHTNGTPYCVIALQVPVNFPAA